MSFPSVFSVMVVVCETITTGTGSRLVIADRSTGRTYDGACPTVTTSTNVNNVLWREGGRPNSYNKDTCITFFYYTSSPSQLHWKATPSTLIVTPASEHSYCNNNCTCMYQSPQLMKQKVVSLPDSNLLH